MAVGVKVTLYVQLEPADNVAPQVVLCANGPVMVAGESAEAVLPVFDRVTVLVADGVLTVCVPNDSDAGVILSTASKPLPDMLVVNVPPPVIAVSVPPCDPIAVGANATVIRQLLPAATLEPHVFVLE
jgi:hypothetical protein